MSLLFALKRIGRWIKERQFSHACVLSTIAIIGQAVALQVVLDSSDHYLCMLHLSLFYNIPPAHQGWYYISLFAGLHIVVVTTFVENEYVLSCQPIKGLACT